MTPESRCDQIQLELSIAHDEGRQPSDDVRSHVENCQACTEFARGLGQLDGWLATGTFDQSPDVSKEVMEAVTPPRRQWWTVAAIAIVGITVGALLGVLGSRLDIGRAQDLHGLFHTTGSGLDGLSAEVLIVERGVHPDVPERVYTGTLDYVAPEEVAIELIDTTEYPRGDWRPNDVRLAISNGDSVSVAGSPCPVAALPGCLVPPRTQAIRDQRPFDEGIVSPLEIVGPGSSLIWSSAVDVVGTPTLDDRPTIQVDTTVAAVELLGAITRRGAWRELHPTDPVLMWLDEETLAPLRIEVFPADSPERELWQLRHDYDDQLGATVPIFIVELSDLVTQPGEVEIEIPENAPSRGFVDGAVDLSQPTLEPGFEVHRTGRWLLVDGGEVEAASWSDGRSWVMVEATADWDEPRLFGLSLPFAQEVDLGEDSVGYLAPAGDAVAIHTEDLDVLVSGSIPVDLLLEVAGSLDIEGVPLPEDWVEASTVDVADLPSGVLVPDVDGWSMLGRVEDSRTTILLTSGGSRSVLITQEDGNRLDPPTGPDFSEVEVRGRQGRYNAATATLEWVDDGRIVRMRSETVGMVELLELANEMELR